MAVGSYLENGMCSFKNVVGDNIFMVADVTDNGALRYLTAPFYVSSMVKCICLYPGQTKSSVIHSIRKKEVGIIHCTIGMLIGNHLYPFLAKAQQILCKHTNRYQKMHYIG